MKSFRFPAILILSLILIINACKKADDSSANATPADFRDKYTGNWDCSETKTQNNQTLKYTISITKSPSDVSEIVINNFNNLTNSFHVYASISGSNLSIPGQNSSGNTVNGSGSIASDTKMNLSYTVNDGQSADAFSAVYTKK